MIRKVKIVTLIVCRLLAATSSQVVIKLGRPVMRLSSRTLVKVLRISRVSSKDSKEVNSSRCRVSSMEHLTVSNSNPFLETTANLQTLRLNALDLKASSSLIPTIRGPMVE